jgi:hypothetical protein
MNTLKLSIIVISIVFCVACKKDTTDENFVPYICDEPISFAIEILPLISTNCSTSGCHSAASATAGYVFTNHTNISENSAIILKTIQHEQGVIPMPLGGSQLSPEQIGKFSCWIEQGKANN